MPQALLGQCLNIWMWSSPEIELTTGFVLDEVGRLVSTREPHASRGPLFTLIRSATQCAWAIRNDVSSEVAEQLAVLASREPPTHDLRTEPVHAREFLALTCGKRGFSGPAFVFPDRIEPPKDVVQVDDETLLARHFQGWVPGEIAAGRTPVLAVLEQGHPVSVCFCARSSDTAAAAGLETAAPFRGRGFGPRVTAAWALTVRSSARMPLYSAAWDNAASLAVARKLRLTAHASFWNVSD